jgi:thioredoxin-related protein
MRKVVIFCLLFCAVLLRAEKIEWLTDLPSGLKKAAAEDKTLFLLFSGADIFTGKLRAEILEKPEFIAFAKSNLITVEIDLTDTNTLSPEVRAENERVAAQFEVNVTPLVFVLDSNGTRLEKGGYVEGGAQNYIAAISKIPGFRVKPSGSETNATAAPTPQPVPLPEITYDELMLRGISRGKQKLALINDKTLSEGESARVKLGDKRVKVQCREIRDKSVIIQVEDESETRELTLKTNVNTLN